jgi:cobalamin biosynthesis protein CobT
MENEVKVPETEVVEETSAVAVEQNTDSVPTEVPVVEATVENDFAASKKDEDENEDEKPSNDEEKEEPSEDDEKKKKDFKKEEEEEKPEENKSEENSDAPVDEKKDEEEDEEKKKKYELLETEFAALQEQYSELETKYNELVAFKAQVEDAKKDEMISKFYFLSDEDKKEVIENKSKYSLDEIEAKLSVICVRNKVNFDLDDNSKNDINTEASDVTTYSLSNEGEAVPAWITAVKNNQKK